MLGEENSVDGPGPSAKDAVPVGDRVFLVVVDDTEEMTVALYYACRRARHTGGRVALLTVIEPTDFEHWMAVEATMRVSFRDDAEALMKKLAGEVLAFSGRHPELYLREGHRADVLLDLLEERPEISILVLAAGTGGNGPGPLISYLVGKGRSRLRLPLTIVPGTLSRADIDAIT